MKKIFLIFIMALGTCIAHAQKLSVNTDLMMLATQIYNFGAEMTIGNRSTLGLTVFGNHNPYIHDNMKVFGVQPEYRYYFGGRPLYHHYVGVGLLAADYNVIHKGVRYDGYALGAGLTFGYVFALSNKWSIDAHAGVGLVGTSHTKTHMDGQLIELNDGSGLTKDGFKSLHILPTKIGLSLSYTIW